MVSRDERGVLHVPLALALVAILTLCFGAWGILRDWRHLSETQLRLDECVGRKAAELRGTLNDLGKADRRMKALRAAIAASTLAPAARAALTAALTAQAAAENLTLAKWSASRAQWLLTNGCGGRGDVPEPLPAIPARPGPPDFLGPRPLTWAGESESRLRIELSHSPRSAAAVVGRRNSALQSLGGLIENDWSANWARPTGRWELGAGFP